METVTFNTVKAVLPLKVPAESKKHTLQLYVRDASKRFNTEGWKTYSIDCRPKDTTPPTVTVSPASGSTIAPGSKIIIHIEDGSGVYDVSHRWDKNSPTTKQLETMGSATFEIIAPLSAGTHTVQLYVRDNSSNYNTQGWLPYSFTIKQ
ncbi:MAG: PASTA domain-containing protein [Ignavibacteriales bacterium]